MNKSVHIEEIPYQPDSCELFVLLRDLPGAIFLDSCAPYSQTGRFDIMVAAPMAVEMPAPPTDAGESHCTSYFAELQHAHREYFADVLPVGSDIPFCGGMVGYLSYDLGSQLHDLHLATPATGPTAFLHAYDWCVLQDHLLRRALFVSLPWVDAARRRDIRHRLRQPQRTSNRPFELLDTFTCSTALEEYRGQFEVIQDYIQAGDCYQVNLARHFTAPCRGDTWLAYRALRPIAAAPFAAFLALDDDTELLSLSPERFLSLQGQHVETSPIKGTRPRHQDHSLDEAAAQALRDSEKDRAENLMIVDLLRNDLGRNCIPGSIHVNRLFEIQSYATVHHMVSTISGELRSDRDAWDLLRDSFPGGSITGAPKRRAMQIIQELEPVSRGPYCGSVLYISADGRMDSNIAIRSLLRKGPQLSCWGGGGIVADSSCDAEYQETWDKVGSYLSSLETLTA